MHGNADALHLSVQKQLSAQQHLSVQNVCRDTMCVQIEQEMAGYMLTKLQAGEAIFPIIGCDARTGVPVRQNVQAAHFQQPS